ncbi:MAG: hypothetical protein K2G34_07425, partial [Bacteroides sp.]|nr:hypothetical protein [Bacteroides sp.]
SDCPPVKCTLIVHSKFLPNNLIPLLLQKKVFNYPLFNSTDYGKKESKINSGNDYSFSPPQQISKLCQQYPVPAHVQLDLIQQ